MPIEIIGSYRVYNYSVKKKDIGREFRLSKFVMMFILYMFIILNWTALVLNIIFFSYAVVRSNIFCPKLFT